MSERMPVIGEADIIDTADEAWMVGQAWYGAAADYACEKLGDGAGKNCLVIGSPIPEVRRLRAAGWWTMFFDIRKPPEDVGPSEVGDATDLAAPDNFFDAVSSTCVLCHAGLGRYGDPVKANGDELMLREIARVLKPGGIAALMAGPAVDDAVIPASVVYGNVHRIYRPADVAAMAEGAGLRVLDSTVFASGEWMGAPEVEEVAGGWVDYGYLSVLLGKPE